MSTWKATIKETKVLYPVLKRLYSGFLEIKALPKYIHADDLSVFVNRHTGRKYLIYHYEGMSGLMTQMICVLGWLRYAELNNFTLIVDMTSGKNLYSDGKSNAWERYFRQPMTSASIGVPEIRDIQENESYGICPMFVRHNLRYEWVYRHISKIIKPSIPFPLPRDYKERPDLQLQFSALYKKYIRFQPDVQSYLEQEYTELLQNKGSVLGVLVRGTDYVQSKPFMHPVQPTLEQVIALIEKKQDTCHWDYIYLATEEQAVSSALRRRYPGRIIENSRSYYDGDYSGQWLYSVLKKSDDMAYLSGLQYLSSIFLLSKCDYLTGGLCGGTQAALIMNGGRYKSVDLFDNGDYGVSEEK